MGYPSVFLDRDGTIVEFVHYLVDEEDLRIPREVLIGLKDLAARNFKLIVVTNQSIIGRGLAEVSAVLDLTKILLRKLKDEGITINLLLICPHAPSQECYCRKPRVAMALFADEVIGIDFPNSFMVGDSLSDMKFGAEMGMKTVFMTRNAEQSPNANFNAKDMIQASRWIIENSSRE